MSSITTAVAVDYRLQQWAQLVKDCQNRPQDMTVEQWCDTKGISKSNYIVYAVSVKPVWSTSRTILSHASR